MHTPEQASELWCPMTRIARLEQVGPAHSHTEPLAIVGGCNTDALGQGNRRMSDGHTPLASCRCIAAKCAMWRWVPRRDPTFERPKTIPGQLARAPLVIPTHGYCGLSSRPEVMP